MKNEKKGLELEKLQKHIIVEVVQYHPNAVVSRTILKRLTGSITLSSFDEGVEIPEKLSSFDTFIQIIDGSAELTVNGKIYTLVLGEGMIIPSHALHHFHALHSFKMLETVIKSGYEQ
jgi:quercetin dioxygenase-like cupin family protein